MMFAEEVYTVLVNWNLKDDTLACVESLFAAGARPGQVIVVDNASSDGSPQALHAAFGAKVRLIRNAENLGFTGGSNLGIEQALDCGAAWVLLINNDTVVAPDFFVEFERVLPGAEQFGVLAPMILYYDHPEQVWFLGDRLVPNSLITRGLFKNRQAPADLDDLIPVDFVCGCGMLVRSEIFRQVGLFDTSLFMYGEEVDLIWRARQAGYQMAAVPAARMWHKVSASSAPDHPLIRYLRIRNQVRFYRKYARGIQKPVMFVFVLVRSSWLALRDLLRGRGGLVLALLRGLVDGWRGAGGNPGL